MFSESPPAKRQRTESEDGSITRSQMWISDGNVVLQASQMQFRVHWSVLARNSSVFRDMQGLPQPPDEPTIDGCPVVHLSDDPNDIGHLLEVLYTPTFLHREKLKLPVIGALIRLGCKYDFKDLFDAAVARIMVECPTTLEDYDLVSDSFKNIEHYIGLDFDLISLASENILAALPSAYYGAVTGFSLAGLFDGIQRDDGTVAHLGGLDLRRCVVAREKLLVKQFEPGYTLGWAQKWDFDGCENSAQCRTSRETVLRENLECADIEALTRPFMVMFHEYCAPCARHVKACIAAGRRKIWEELPDFFDLPPWSELENDM
ncbi:BTB domain-containing protein [Mycena sanguinolenta]|uniref:BTB domain-containing protein n=1 Tax=Mycena sanguinolenta TaxID=230812 RepID=A0A8H7DGE1_9AGAR|nr:BTB domain-containing protein [Mycena sanguinolenta]